MVAVPSRGRATDVTPRRSAPEADATRALYERYAGQIHSYCLHQLGNREEAEDAVQSTFLNAFRGFQRGVDPEFEAAWIYKIAQNVCLTRLRSSSRRRRLESPGDLDAMQDVLPSHSVDSDELIGLPQALESMPAQQRRALLLREWQGLSYREIADELDLSQAAVETLLFRARRSLAAGLTDASTVKRVGGKLRVGGEAGSLLAFIQGFFGSGGSKVAATVATVAATSLVAATPAARHAVEHAVGPSATERRPVALRVGRAPGGPADAAGRLRSTRLGVGAVQWAAGAPAAVEAPGRSAVAASAAARRRTPAARLARRGALSRPADGRSAGGAPAPGGRAVPVVQSGPAVDPAGAVPVVPAASPLPVAPSLPAAAVPAAPAPGPASVAGGEADAGHVAAALPAGPPPTGSTEPTGSSAGAGSKPNVAGRREQGAREDDRASGHAGKDAGQAPPAPVAPTPPAVPAAPSPLAPPAVPASDPPTPAAGNLEGAPAAETPAPAASAAPASLDPGSGPGGERRDQGDGPSGRRK